MAAVPDQVLSGVILGTAHPPRFFTPEDRYLICGAAKDNSPLSRNPVHCLYFLDFSFFCFKVAFVNVYSIISSRFLRCMLCGCIMWRHVAGPREVWTAKWKSWWLSHQPQDCIFWPPPTRLVISSSYQWGQFYCIKLTRGTRGMSIL